MSSTFKVHPEPNHFSPPPRPPAWSRSLLIPSRCHIHLLSCPLYLGSYVTSPPLPSSSLQMTLHWLFPLPESFLPHPNGIPIAHPLASFRSIHKCHLLNRSSLASLVKMAADSLALISSPHPQHSLPYISPKNVLFTFILLLSVALQALLPPRRQVPQGQGG